MQRRARFLKRISMRSPLCVAEETSARAFQRGPQAGASRRRLGPILVEREIQFDHYRRKRLRLGLLGCVDREGRKDEETQDQRQQQSHEPDHRADRTLGFCQNLRWHHPLQEHADNAGPEGCQSRRRSIVSRNALARAAL